MTPIQQLMLGVGASKKTYIDDIYSTYVWEGNSTENTNINNGINLSGEGGMVWIKKRNSSDDNLVYDTNRGHNERIITNSDTDNGGLGQRLTGFNTNGFKLGNNTQVNASSNDYTSFSFRKAKGFFDVVTWTGAGETYKNISHNLGSVPGCIIVKKYLGGSGDWFVYHQGLNNGTNSWQYRVALNKTWAEASAGQSFLYSAPTATQFQIGDWFTSNDNTYIAYVFAGGESTAATATSVDFGGSNNTNDSYLSIGNHNDFNLGTGDFTCEFWVRPDGLTVSGDHWKVPFSLGDSNDYIRLTIESGGSGYVVHGGSSVGDFPGKTFFVGQWTHVAIVRHSNVLKIFANGLLYASTSFTATLDYSNSGDALYIGKDFNYNTTSWNGQISNFRLVKGTAVYTSSFRPPTEPLTNISGTVVLCCQNSSNTGSTVIPSGTSITQALTTASTNSPFDDPAAFTFGDSKEGIIKTGSYVGNGSSTGPNIDLGWEPQWILIKNVTDANSYWMIFDSMRGIATGGNSYALYSNGNDAEDTATNYIDLTSTGFKATIGSNTEVNKDGSTYIFTAIRRPDGYVGKPAEAGTDVFTMDFGNASTTIPSHDSGFPVDFAAVKTVGSNSSWNASARLMHEKFLIPDLNSDEDTSTGYPFDSNVGWGAADWLSSSVQSWMWKRHKGFDVVTYKGNQVNGRHIKHNLGQAPEMIWIKNRDSAQDWVVGHKGVNGGTNPWDYFLELNNTTAQQDYPLFNDFTPTSTVFSTHNNSKVNWTDNYIALLFSSVEGISKVGYYTGTSGQLQLRNLGFTPRFLLVKRTDGTGNWVVIDTVTGWGSGDDYKLFLNTSGSQVSQDVGDPVSSGGGGFDLYSGNDDFNNTDNKYIYYAHA